MKTFWRVLLGFLSTSPVGCGTESAPTEKPAPEMHPTAVEKQDLPYEIASRPMPTGNDLDTLLPLQIGPYTRAPIEPPDSPEQSIYANYTHGGSTIFVELAICPDASDAQIALARAKAETDAEFPDAAQVFVKWQDVTCLRCVTRLGALMAWTRGPYYFSAHAKRGEKDLDEFMTAFPY